ncbi:hypothetical protein [Derxia gummosa]|uniref:Uncharacterized protein n=1 Tax=Derxia gummosa DSM 723 TaxID=1121388 RepID=A0A8B6X5D2_9BURK|nr:hypothetical protein [Derxia gummosa]
MLRPARLAVLALASLAPAAAHAEATMGDLLWMLIFQLPVALVGGAAQWLWPWVLWPGVAGLALSALAWLLLRAKPEWPVIVKLAALFSGLVVLVGLALLGAASLAERVVPGATGWV